MRPFSPTWAMVPRGIRYRVQESPFPVAVTHELRPCRRKTASVEGAHFDVYRAMPGVVRLRVTEKRGLPHFLSPFLVPVSSLLVPLRFFRVGPALAGRSEEHTSELQSLRH